MFTPLRYPIILWNRARSIGAVITMDEYEKRKLSVFNQLNVVGVLCGVFLPVAGYFDDQRLPFIAHAVAFSPAIISSLVLVLNYKKKHELSRLVYFSLYPVVTSLVYAVGLDLGVELFFILYGVLAVFYMERPRNAFIAFFVSALCYLITYIQLDDFWYQLKAASFNFYILNHCVAIFCLFFAVSWIKKENTGYQLSIVLKNEELVETNLEIEKQKEVIFRKAEQLAELNSVKNKLFSIISHDLKTPLYALRNMFWSIQQHDLPGDELKQIIPDIVNDLNYTTSLMENLLLWAKSQMQADSILVQPVDVSSLVNETTQLLRRQAEIKHVYIENKVDQPVYVYADKDMLNLVLRNLITNAIKFTPEQGCVTIDAADLSSDVEISVTDTGIGMPRDVLQKLAENNFYTSKGTANEIGTGIGLMLCKDFLNKIGSKMFIESEYGRGSTFSFVLPKPARH